MRKIIMGFFAVCCLGLFVSCAAKDKDTGYYTDPTENYLGDNNDDYFNEEYKRISENPIMDVSTSPLSTFSIDVDTAAYSNIRRVLNDGNLPTKDMVRTEEMINYFTYDYPAPVDAPISIYTEVAECPWNTDHDLAMIAIQGEKIVTEELPPNNLVFLVDVSGSMSSEDKLPLAKSSLKLLVEQLRHEDRISIVTYSGSTQLLLEPTRGDQKDEIILAIDSLDAGGSTAGGAGIQLAYQTAREYFMEDGNNRVILTTDGDFNVGISSETELENFIASKRDEGIYLSVLGFGTGNIKDNKMETLADKGNGNYAYIDSLLEGKKVLVEQMGSTLLTISKDVKVQLEFNADTVDSYRLIGYENRVMDNEDFDDDTKDAGEIGSGFTVTAFYELIPVENREVSDDTLMTVRVNYKEPVEDTSKQIEKVVVVSDITDDPSENFLFASSVAEFGLILRASPFKGNADFDQVISRATLSKGIDELGYRGEFIRLVGLAKDLKGDRDLTD